MSYSWKDSGEAPRLRYKGEWGKTSKLEATGGAGLVDGLVLIGAANDVGNKRFKFWVYPSLPTGNEFFEIAHSRLQVEQGPPHPFYTNGGKFDPTEISPVLHALDANRYRLKGLVTAYNGDGQPWDLYILDTAWDLIRT